MTGAYVRVKRNEKCQSIEIEYLTDEEIGAFASAHSEDGWKWATFLAKWIRENVT